MTKPKTTTWEIEPHTKAKHEILRRYLGAWFGIMMNSNPKILFVDGFCGPGRYIKGEEGSPLIALNIAKEQLIKCPQREVVLLFIDQDQDRIEFLKREIDKQDVPSNIHINYVHNDFENSVSNILDGLQKAGQSLLPSFVFIDPFGFNDFPFAIVEKLLKNQRTEVFINVMVDFINRFLSDPNEKLQKVMCELYGTTEVLNIINKPDDRVRQLQDLYKDQLLKNAKYVRYFEMRDRDKRIIYTLFFATNSILGYVKMKEAMWKVDCQSGISFSDATDSNQPLLFSIDPTPDLVAILVARFSKKKVMKSDLQTFVDGETVYISKHLTSALLKMEKEGMICVNSCKADGKKRRANSFPETCTIIFLK